MQTKKMHTSKERPSRKRPKRDLLDRLYLGGFYEMFKSNYKLETILWAVALIYFYYSCAYYTYIQLEKFYFPKSLVSPIEIFSDGIWFPVITVCHTANFNKTYLKETIVIPESIRQSLNMSHDHLLAEFARYLNLFSPMNSVGQFSENLWKKLTEIYEFNFRDVQFSDFVSDAGHRSREVFKNCEYGGTPYPCTQTQIAIDSPSCYMVLVNSTYKSYFSPLSVVQKGLKFEMDLDMKNVFNEWNPDADYKIDQLGVSLIISYTPTPFNVHTMFPGNSHAIISLQSTQRSLITDCYQMGQAEQPKVSLLSTFYSKDNCLAEGVLNATMEMCNCSFIAGSHLPKNDRVCTPEMMRNCVKKKIVAADIGDEANLTLTKYWKNRCKPSCSHEIYDANVAFYALENENISNTIIRNKFTLTYGSRRQLIWIEKRPVDIYIMFSYIGGIWITYTGASGVAVIHTIFLLVSAGFRLANRKCMKRVLSTQLQLPFMGLSKRSTNGRSFSVKRHNRVAPL